MYDKELIQRVCNLTCLKEEVVRNQTTIKYDTEHPFTLEGLSFVGCKIEYALDIELTEEELYEVANNKRSMIIRDGKPLLVLGGGSSTKLISVAYKDGWDIPQKDK